MKKLFISALVALTVITSAFAADTKKVSSQVLSSFSGQFRNAENVTWTSTSDYAKATFVVNNERMEAFYKFNGEIIGTSKGISINQLPTNAKRAFAKKYDGYNVKKSIRFEGSEEGAYFISAENEKESVVLKVSDNNLISVFQQTKK